MKELKELNFEELESVEDLGAFSDFMEGFRNGVTAGAAVVTILAVVGIT